jgi:purine-binding chemotaxis protein CheW
MSPQAARHDSTLRDTGPANAGAEIEYVTLNIADQLFGLPITEVHEVFTAHQITRVPLAPHAVRGLLNLRGRVVTAVCLRTVLDLPDLEGVHEPMAIGVESDDESFALLVDRIGDVMRLPVTSLEPNPIHMNDEWQVLSRGVHRLDGSILVILDLAKIIASERICARAA